MPFVKLYGQQLLKSSLWEESPAVFKLFAAMLCSADAEGYVDVFNVAALARMSNISREDAVAALAVLESPDPESRTKVLDGRRVVREPDGRWLVVNAVAYRELRTDSQIAEAERKSRQRANSKKRKSRKKPEAPSGDDADAVRRREIAAFDAICGNGPYGKGTDEGDDK